MEYLIGSVLTLATVISCNLLLRKKASRVINVGVQFSQSRSHELLKPLGIISDLVKLLAKSDIPTQSKKHYDGQHVRVIMSDTEAYWISNNKFYMADVINNTIVQETTREVDTMVMDDVQLNKIIEIVEMLGRDDDRGNKWNKEF